MFDDDDPVLAQLREICLALPGADVKVSHGRPAFFTKKIFAGYGAVLKGEHHSDQYDHALVFMPDPDEAEAYDTDDRFFVPAYWGPYGWRGLDLAQQCVEIDSPALQATTQVAQPVPVHRVGKGAFDPDSPEPDRQR